ncbi:hypothetical protein [uncultured Methanobrevibacter sp.]|uniref:hypothetical protein n=1 Tax=uncultured Methanobrevibacter sp. TaxID=253161 RepID=UPI0025E2B0ED|nr:hypothetical protein [uncultured Methanobrevibacter sp.]
MDNKIKIIIIIVLLAIISSVFLFDFNSHNSSSNVNHWENDLGSIDKIVYGNQNSDTELVLIAGIHPREKLAIEPEIKAAKEFAEKHDVKFTVYHVNVTKNPDDYQQSRDNGESLVHDYIVPDINNTKAKAVIISHSHIEGYGEGFYLATPAMDKASVEISQKIANSSDFRYFPRDVSQPIKATSATLVSNPIAYAGYPTFVYEIPENINDQDSTNKALELFELMYNTVKK